MAKTFPRVQIYCRKLTRHRAFIRLITRYKSDNEQGREQERQELTLPKETQLHCT